MAVWVQTLTAVGRQMFLSGGTITFTKIQVGNGTLPEGTQLESLTALVSPVMAFNVSSVARTGDQITVRAAFSNAQVGTQFVYRELGLFASDGTSEKLVFVGNCGSTAETIPAVIDGSVSRSMKIMINCEAASSITITVQPETYLSADGDGSQLTVPFSEPSTATIDTLASGAKLSVLIGAIKRLIRNQGTAIAGKADISHTQAISTITGLQDALDGKASTSHTQAASTITAGTLAGEVVANATAQGTLSNAQVRNIYAGTADMTAGTTALPTGTVYFVYE